MKKLLLLFIFLVFIQGIANAQIKSKVDECFELTSIAFRMAEAPEYSRCGVPKYAKDIDSTFAPFLNHKLIQYAKDLRKQYGVSYNAISSAAACLEIRNGKVVLKRGIDISKISEVDKRWTPRTFNTFLKHLDDFYKKAKFRDFYTQHSDLYTAATQSLDERLATINIDWFESVFGEKLENPIVIASLTNGPSNYAFLAPDKTKRFGIAVGAGCDNKGEPAYSPGFVSIILHEFLHKYTNPRIYDNWAQIDSAAQKIYPYVKEYMYKIGYGSAQTTMVEWFDNLLVCIYFKEHPQIQKTINIPAAHFIAEHQNRGFIWMERSVLFMQHFFSNRERYPTIDSFMPELVNFINYTADHFDQVLNEFNNRQPYVVDVFPISGSTISSDLDSVIIRFSEPMYPFMGFHYVTDKSIPFPTFPKNPEWKDEYTLIIYVGKLDDGKTYGIAMPSYFFKSRKTYTMKDSFEYIFKVKQ